jgi:hypothetical protein
MQDPWGKKASTGVPDDDDLLALERQNAWPELASRLRDVRPSARGASWERLAEEAATAWLSMKLDAQEISEAHFLAEGLLADFPTLTRSRTFMQRRGDAALGHADRCFHARRYDAGAHCNSELFTVVVRDPDNADLAFRAGKVVLANQIAAAAVPFFKRVVIVNHDEARACSDDGVMRSMFAGLAYPDSEQVHADAQAIREACRSARNGKTR